MKIAVLPFNAGPNTEPSFARQSSGFVGEVVRQMTDHEINPVSYMGRADENGMPRFAHINPSESLNEIKMITDFFEQSDTDKVVDGLLTEAGAGSGNIVVRWFERGSDEPVQKEYSYLPGGMLKALRSLVEDFASNVGADVPQELSTDQGLFGTDNAEAFRNFLTGYDATQYVERAQGMVLSTFDPQPALDSLLGAAQADADWEAPYLTLIELARLCTLYRLGHLPKIEKSLLALIDLEPKDARARFTLGNLYAAAEMHDKAAEVFEKAHAVQPDEPSILTRLGQEQFALGMPVNAERTFKKAIELEGEDKPTMDYLANVLTQTGRAHEVPELWRSLVASTPQSAQARTKLAVSLLRAGKKDDAKETFEKAIVELEDSTIAKRYYAPVLVEEEDFDKAMDLYEDVLDVVPTDVSVLTEYAQTLDAAGREFEVPKVLRDILAANPDQNTKATTNAWLLEIEQPKRVAAVKSASEKSEAGDPKAALEELNPLRTWLADYWKFWAVLASIHNSLNDFGQAEDASRRALEIYPACEPVYGELCTALAGLGREQEAYNLMKFALSNMPNSLMIAINYGLAARRAGDKEEARKIARQIREFTNDAENLKHLLAEIEA